MKAARIAAYTLLGCFLISCTQTHGSWNGNPLQPPAGGGSLGEMTSWGVLRAMSLMAFAPGLAAFALSLFIASLAPIRRLAFGLLALGLFIAILPWILEKFGPALFWPTTVLLSSGMALAAWWFLHALFNRMKAQQRLVEIKEQEQKATDPYDKVKHTVARTVLERQLDPKVDKLYRNGERRIDVAALLHQPTQRPAAGPSAESLDASYLQQWQPRPSASSSEGNSNGPG